MSIVKKLTLSIAAAAMLAGTFGATSNASASGLSRQEAAILAGAGGFILGAIVGSSGHNRRHARVIHVDYWDAHISRCLSRYRTYDPGTDTYIGYDGYEHRCRL